MNERLLTLRREDGEERYPWEFQGVVRLTKVGMTYILATVVLAVAAINTGNNALYLAVALMLGCLLLSGIASKSGLKHLTIEIRDIDEAWAGRPAEGLLHVRNASRIWNVRDVILTSEGLAEPVLLPVVPRRSEVEARASFLFLRRGLAHVSAIDSYTRYPFGFVLKKRRLRVESEVVVFPRLTAEEPQRDLFRAASGDENSANRPGSGHDIHAFREYSRGDSLRQVHWKKSASLGRWIMKQHDSDVARSVHVVVDPYKPRKVSEEDFEEMISAAATFIHHAVRRGLDVTLALPRVTVRAKENESAAPLFRALALVEATHEPVHQLLERDSVLFAVSGGQHDAKSA
ncbi:MAG TPA: DUF58 domain-containing protein [Thermoanaerobaculia bacterium]|nr:DUF58 domain-containing protein [Thermoanaerobaculia bacterium]